MIMISIALMLFLIMDPFGNLVPVNTLLADHTPRRRQLILLRESAIAAAMLLLAAVAGGKLLRMLGLGEHSLSISGGIVLFLIALEMLFPARRGAEEVASESPVIVPIAMPLLAGPSAISMVILFAERYTIAMVCGAVLMASAASAALLGASPVVFRYLGRQGTCALERLMGMILILISVQMILNGFDAYLTSRS
jgi:multiple antibiotic resistance protein